ncbi:MAG TPA: hypothetical protein VNA68_02540 [Candidatus Dormibacteraeota bacterium]|nr:hypothetical protein [Candidatus Dormibacteraeota bacterium]
MSTLEVTLVVIGLPAFTIGLGLAIVSLEEDTRSNLWLGLPVVAAGAILIWLGVK